jgi:hypothetical protein
MFAALGPSKLDTDLNLIREAVQRLEEYRPKDNAPLTYLTVRTPEKEGLLQVSYFTTRADQANRIPLGAKMHRTPGAAFKADGSMLLTSTLGGRKPLTQEEQLPAFKKALISRDRIVTSEDIRNFCFAELGDKIRQVEIRKGVRVGDTKPQGLKRTIDVCLVPAPGPALPAEQWAEITHRLASRLRSHSNDLIEYRVLLTA